MGSYQPTAVPWRAATLAVAVLALVIPPARAGAPESGKARYVVILDDSRADTPAVAEKQARTHRFAVAGLFDRGVRGYVGVMNPASAKLLARAPGVKAVAPDAPVTTSVTPAATTQDLPASPSLWGLDRIDQGALPLNRRYRFNMTGSGVTAYVVDTGVKSGHTEFGGRVRRAPDFDAYRQGGDAAYGEDCDGHGTHVAGTLGGKTYGVAKSVELVSVRVLDCDGSGFVSDIVAGLGWMIADHQDGRPAVANLSLGASRNSALDAAVQQAIDDGITVTVAAGNGGTFGAQDACSVSPARVPQAVTVAATDAKDKKPSWSNYGTCVDLFAPGAGIVSADGAGSGTSAWASMSGTSMAAPHVAGVAALLLSAVPGAAPAKVRDALVAVATADKVTSAKTTNPKLLYAPF
ncbi:MAG TPA: S8 family serine peptidase, partial [Acidimicrobiia bacterium]|nr:S8 family serine peptidase [Acidimicrobiia bacterium]